MNKKQYTKFSKRMVMAVVFTQIALCVATVALSCFGFDMTIGIDVIKADIPFASVVFAAYAGNSAVEKWLTRSARSGVTDAEESAVSNG